MARGRKRRRSSDSSSSSDSSLESLSDGDSLDSSSQSSDSSSSSSSTSLDSSSPSDSSDSSSLPLLAWHGEFQMPVLCSVGHHTAKRSFALASIARDGCWRLVPLFAPTSEIEGHLTLRLARYDTLTFWRQVIYHINS